MKQEYSLNIEKCRKIIFELEASEKEKMRGTKWIETERKER